MIERALALEVEDRVHDVLERPGPRDSAAFSDMTDEQDGRARLFREPHESRGAFAHLAHVAGRALELVRIGGLNRVDEDDPGIECPRVMHDRLEARLTQHMDRAGVDRETLGPQPDLLGRFLPRDVESGDSRAFEARGALQQQGGLPNTGLASHQNHRPRNNSAAQHEVELSEASLPPIGRCPTHVGQPGRR